MSRDDLIDLGVITAQPPTTVHCRECGKVYDFVRFGLWGGYCPDCLVHLVHSQDLAGVTVATVTASPEPGDR